MACMNNQGFAGRMVRIPFAREYFSRMHVSKLTAPKLSMYAIVYPFHYVSPYRKYALPNVCGAYHMFGMHKQGQALAAYSSLVTHPYASDREQKRDVLLTGENVSQCVRVGAAQHCCYVTVVVTWVCIHQMLPSNNYYVLALSFPNIHLYSTI